MPQRVHRKQVRKFGVGVAAIAVMAVIAWIGFSGQTGGELPVKGYTYVKAAFADVGILKRLNPVEQNGVRIGQVSAVSYRDGRAIVTMRLDGKRDVYADARARVGNNSALGRKYVELDPGTPAAGPLGNRTIAASRNTDSEYLDSALATFDKRTRTALRTSLVELGGGLAGHSGDLQDVMHAAPGMLADVGTVSDALTGPRADLPGLLGSANQLAGRFAGHEQELSTLLEQMDATFRAINVDGGQPLNRTAQALPDTLRQARDDLKSLNGPLTDVRATTDTVRTGAQALGESADDVRGLLREAPEQLDKVPGVSERAVPAVRELTRTVADARPLAPRLGRMASNANVLLRGLAPYASDIGRFVSEHDLLSGRIAPNKHYFSLFLVIPGLATASLPDPTVETVPYPEPGGGAWHDNPGTGGNG